MAAMITFECPNCGNVLQVQDTFAGRRGYCRKCRGRVFVPGPESSDFRDELMVALSKLKESRARAEQLQEQVDALEAVNAQAAAPGEPPPDGAAAEAMDALAAERDALAAQVAELERGLAALRDERGTLQAEVKRLRDAVDRAEAAQNRADAQAAALRRDVDAAKAEGAALRQSVEHAKAQAEAQDRDLAAAKAEAAARKARCAGLEQKAEELRAALESAKQVQPAPKADDELATLRRRADDAEARLATQARELAAARAEVAKAAALQARCADLEQQAKDLAGALEAAERALADATAQPLDDRPTASAHAELEQALERERAKAEALGAQVQALEHRAAEAEAETAPLRTQCADLEQQAKDLTSALADAKQALADAPAQPVDDRPSAAAHDELKQALEREHAKAEALDAQVQTLQRRLAEAEAVLQAREEALQAAAASSPDPERENLEHELDKSRRLNERLAAELGALLMRRYQDVPDERDRAAPAPGAPDSDGLVVLTPEVIDDDLARVNEEAVDILLRFLRSK